MTSGNQLQLCVCVCVCLWIRKGWVFYEWIWPANPPSQKKTINTPFLFSLYVCVQNVEREITQFLIVKIWFMLKLLWCCLCVKVFNVEGYLTPNEMMYSQHVSQQSCLTSNCVFDTVFANKRYIRLPEPARFISCLATISVSTRWNKGDNAPKWKNSLFQGMNYLLYP